jgi:hypothetical protein
MNGMAIVCCTGTVIVINASPPSRSVNRLSYWSRRKRKKKSAKVDSARGANTPCTMQKTLYEKSIIRVDDVETLKQFRAGKESRRRTAGLPSFDRKYQACVIGCRLFFLNLTQSPHTG